MNFVHYFNKTHLENDSLDEDLDLYMGANIDYETNKILRF